MSVEVFLECAPALWRQVAAAAACFLLLLAPASLSTRFLRVSTLMKRRSYKPCHVFPYSFLCPTHEAAQAAHRTGTTETTVVVEVVEAYKKDLDFEFPKLF